MADTCKYDRLQYELAVEEWEIEKAAMAAQESRVAIAEVKVSEKHQIYLNCQAGQSDPGGPAVP